VSAAPVSPTAAGAAPAPTAPARQVVRLGPPTGGPADLISPAVRYGDLVFVSGQAGLDPATMRVVSDDVADQARAALDQLAAILEAAGTSLGNVLHLECYLAEAADFATWNAVYAGYFPVEPPARTTLVVGFAVPGMRIEVGAVAAVPGGPAPAQPSPRSASS